MPPCRRSPRRAPPIRATSPGSISVWPPPTWQRARTTRPSMWRCVRRSPIALTAPMLDWWAGLAAYRMGKFDVAGQPFRDLLQNAPFPIGCAAAPPSGPRAPTCRTAIPHACVTLLALRRATAADLLWDARAETAGRGERHQICRSRRRSGKHRCADAGSGRASRRGTMAGGPGRVRA